MTEPRAGLWDWALEAYARPGVADACLALQDEQKQNVPLMLWVAWAAERGQGPDPAALQDGAALARTWQNAVIGPVRELRRRLKPPVPDVAESDRGAIRAQVKTTELDAERRLLLALEPLAALPGPGRPERA
ncbi:MAG: TIGR02444 family protein, partial [Pseudomonadota bacterium]|nr:TIGR02444 family protein [Pseudomonadota bacterium]